MKSLFQFLNYGPIKHTNELMPGDFVIFSGWDSKTVWYVENKDDTNLYNRLLSYKGIVTVSNISLFRISANQFQSAIKIEKPEWVTDL